MPTTITEITPLIGFQGNCTINNVSGRFSDLAYNPKAYTMIDVTATSDGGKKTYAKGCYDESITGTLILDTSSDFASIKAACEARTAVQCSFTLGTGTGAISFSGLMHPNFTGPMNCTPDDKVTVPFECRPAPTVTTTTNSDSP